MRTLNLLEEQELERILLELYGAHPDERDHVMERSIDNIDVLIEMRLKREREQANQTGRAAMKAKILGLIATA